MPHPQYIFGGFKRPRLNNRTEASELLSDEMMQLNNIYREK
jgi:hypothetical protein